MIEDDAAHDEPCAGATTKIGERQKADDAPYNYRNLFAFARCFHAPYHTPVKALRIIISAHWREDIGGCPSRIYARWYNRPMPESPKAKPHLLRRFIAYYGPHKRLFVLDMLASFGISAIALVYPVLSRFVIRDYIPDKNYRAIIFAAMIMLVLYVVRMLLRYFVQYKGHVMGTRMQAAMRSDMFAHLEKLPYSFYDEHETGRIMSRMTSDLQDVSELAHHGPENFFISGFMLIATFIYLMTLNWIMTLIIFSVVPVVVFIAARLKRNMSEAFTASRRSIASINASLQNSITGIRVTKAFDNAEEEQRKFERSNQDFIRDKSKAYKAMGQFQSSTAFVTDLFNVIVLVSGALFMAGGVFEFDVLVAFIISINMFISPLTTLINFTEQFEDGVTGFRRFIEIIDSTPEEDAPDAKSIGRVEGSIVFENVHFHYGNNEDVLHGIDLSITPGEKFALVGPSGGGKTTICHLLPRFYKVEEGRILLDGVNINDLRMDSLRENIGIVQQDVFLFDGTIEENIRYGKLSATEDEVYEAAKKARLLEYVESLPDGFQTQVGERGVKLSGGQKQRISIARVFLKNPAILILDEATSALDNVTELLIQEALDDLCRGRTCIIVAHRLSTIKSAHRIAVIAKGKLQELGSHDELMALPGGIYSGLYRLQFKVDEESGNFLDDPLLG